MLVQSPVAGDSRVLREAATLAGAGHEVHFIGRDVPEGFDPGNGVTAESVSRSRGMRSARVRSDAASFASGTAARLRRAGRWLLLPEHRERVEEAWRAEARLRAVRSGPYDVVHAHDFNTLELGAELAQAWRVPLVYDSHEYWTGRPVEGRPTPVQLRRVRRRERELGRRAAVVITVGRGVAEALREAYGFANVLVVRNTFPRLPDGERASGEKPNGLVYAGRLAADRELEVIAAASHQLKLPVTLVGPADDTWLGRFDPGRAIVEPPAPIEAVDRMVAAAGLALVTHSDRWPNHRLAMPNKLFHAVRAGVPVVATDVGELAREVRTHDLGTLYRPGDPDALVAAVEEAVADYHRLHSRVLAATNELSWEVDAEVLVDAYRELAR